VVAAVLLVVGRGIHPRPGAVARVFGATLIVAAAAGTANLLTGGNYMWLREKPDTWSLLDVMGPWPWYILSAAVLALVLFTLLALPFRRREAGAGGRQGPRGGGRPRPPGVRAPGPARRRTRRASRYPRRGPPRGRS
jgi:uncharacterized membrane protein YwaF